MKPHIYAEAISVRFPIRRASVRSNGARSAFDALREVSLEISAGERVGLLGRNGAGKSTLLRTLAGVYPVDHGKLELTGSVSAIFNAQLGFQQDATGVENIYIRGALMGLRRSEIADLEPRIIEFAGLGDWIHQPIHLYSSGMALRLAFSIATTIQGEILLLDEWLGAGDAGFLDKARKKMRDLVDQASILVLATHNLGLMRSQCTRAIVIDEGGIKFDGDMATAIDIYQELREQA